VGSGIRYDGDNGSDQLQLLQTGGATWSSDVYSVGPAIGSGVSTIVGGGTAGTQVVFFEDLSPVLDLVPAALLTVNATAADNAINYSVGSAVTNGLVTIDEHEPIEFANKTALTINAGAGQDTISLNNPNTPTGLTGITINGGDPSSGDTLTVTGVGSAVAVNTATATISGATGEGGAVPISYGTIENLNLLAGIGDLTLTTTGADDTVVVTPGLTTGTNSGTVQSSGALPQIAFANSGTLTANLAGGSDALVVNGSSSADTIAVSGTAVAITGRRAVNYTGVEALTVNGNAGSDTFNVTPSPAVAMFIDGGDPVAVKPGDLLNIIAGRGSIVFNAGPERDEGSFVVGANQPVSFDHIESLAVNGKRFDDKDAHDRDQHEEAAEVVAHGGDHGLVDLNYGTARFVVQYDEIESRHRKS
jgi:large repetitive protein